MGEIKITKMEIIFQKPKQSQEFHTILLWPHHKSKRLSKSERHSDKWQYCCPSVLPTAKGPCSFLTYQHHSNPVSNNNFFLFWQFDYNVISGFILFWSSWSCSACRYMFFIIIGTILVIISSNILSTPPSPSVTTLMHMIVHLTVFHRSPSHHSFFIPFSFCSSD